MTTLTKAYIVHFVSDTNIAIQQKAFMDGG